MPFAGDPAMCWGKASWPAKGAARVAAREMQQRRRGARQGGPQPVAYLCQGCGQWHVGLPLKPVKRHRSLPGLASRQAGVHEIR